jgi:hypothetical protein
MGKKRNKRKRRSKAARVQARLAKNPGVSSLLLVNPAPVPKKPAPAPKAALIPKAAPTLKAATTPNAATAPATFTQKQLNTAVATALKGRTMPQRAKREAVGKPKRPKRPRKSSRARTPPAARPAAQHTAPTVQIINSPEGTTKLQPTTRRKRDGKKMSLDLTRQYRGLVPRKGPWKGKHPTRGIRTLEKHKKSILWNLGKGSPGAQQWVMDHIPKLNPAADVKDTGKEVLIGVASFLGTRIAGNMVGKLPILSRMGAAGSVLTSAGVAGLGYFLLGKKFPQLKKPLLVGGAIGLLDSVIKNFVVPHAPSIGGVLGDAELALPQANPQQLALSAHSSIGDNGDDASEEDPDDLHARSVAAHRMLGYEDDDGDDAEELRSHIRNQRGMGFDVRPALAGCGPAYPRHQCGPDCGYHAGYGDYEGGMGFDVHPAVADYERGMGFDVHPAVADYEGGMGFDVHPAVADYEGGMGFDVHPAVAGDDSAMADDGMGYGDEALSDDSMGGEESMADSGDGLGMNVHEAQAGVDDMSSYASTGTGALDEGQGAYVHSGTGAYAPVAPSTYLPRSAYLPSSGMGAYLPMNGVDAEEIAAMLFGGPWALAQLNAMRRRRRHRHHGRPHHPMRRGRWLLDPRTRRWHLHPLADSDDDGEEFTADEARRQRGVMGIDDMHEQRRHPHYRHPMQHPHHGHPHYQHDYYGHHRRHQHPMHLECDFYLPHYEGYHHFRHRPHPMPPPRHRPHSRHAPQNWHPMHAPPPAQPMSQYPMAEPMPQYPMAQPMPQYPMAQPVPQHFVPAPMQQTMAPASPPADQLQPGPLTSAVAHPGGIFASHG